jgi:chromosome segregation ATPase
MTAASKNSLASVYETVGEVRFELEAVEGRERDTRLLAERNREKVEASDERIESLSSAYDSLSKVLNEELERLDENHSAHIKKLNDSTSNITSSASSTNARINDIMTDQQTLRSRVEDDLERMKGQLRQSRIEIDDVRRQTAVTADLQTAVAEINANQKELAKAVGGLQQSSIYISEWVQTLRSEAAELRALVGSVQTSETSSSRALAADVAVLAEDISALRSKSSNQDAEFCDLRETLANKVEQVAASVGAAVSAERKEVQAVLQSVKTTMGRQAEQNQGVMQSLHAGQQRLQEQIGGVQGDNADKMRRLEAGLERVSVDAQCKAAELARGMEEKVGNLQRHVDANDQAVRLVTDMMGGALRGGQGGGGVSPERGAVPVPGAFFK